MATFTTNQAVLVAVPIFHQTLVIADCSMSPLSLVLVDDWPISRIGEHQFDFAQRSDVLCLGSQKLGEISVVMNWPIDTMRDIGGYNQARNGTIETRKPIPKQSTQTLGRQRNRTCYLQAGKHPRILWRIWTRCLSHTILHKVTVAMIILVSFLPLTLTQGILAFQAISLATHAISCTFAGKYPLSADGWK